MQRIVPLLVVTGVAARHVRLPGGPRAVVAHHMVKSHEVKSHEVKSHAVHFRNSRSAKAALSRGPHPYGDPKCPCVGFDNMQGEMQFQIDKKTTAWYPAETGGTCKAWDYLHYPSECNTGHDDDFARNGTYPDWCLQQWCYVDPCNCELTVPPKISKYMPDATFQGKALYYSYATCGEKDIWTSKHHTGKAAAFKVVSGECQLNDDGTCVQSPNYPDEYLDNQACEIEGTPGAVVYTTSFQTEHGYDFMKIDGVQYHGTKGPDEVRLTSGKISWASDMSDVKKGWEICTDTQFGACVNQADKASCTRLDKCAWDSAGNRCMGKEALGACEVKDPVYGSHDPPCQCIGIDGLDGVVDANIGGLHQEKLVKYPRSMGAKCSAWDAGSHPDCCGPSPPDWCTKQWCYVSPCSCKILTSPKLSAYFPDVLYQGKPLYYSYATCGEEDTYTEKEHLQACVNQITEEACATLPKCAWTGKECLGKDLVETCHGLPDPLPKSSAWNVASCTIFMMLLVVSH